MPDPQCAVLVASLYGEPALRKLNTLVPASPWPGLGAELTSHWLWLTLRLSLSPSSAPSPPFFTFSA